MQFMLGLPILELAPHMPVLKRKYRGPFNVNVVKGKMHANLVLKKEPGTNSEGRRVFKPATDMATKSRRVWLFPCPMVRHVSSLFMPQKGVCTLKPLARPSGEAQK